MSRTVKVILRVYTVDALGQVVDSIPWVDEEWTVDLAQPTSWSVPSAGGAFSPVNTGAIVDGITDPSIVLAVSDQVVTFTPGANPKGHIFLCADINGGDTGVNTLDLATEGAATTAANVTVFSAGEHV